MRNVLITSSEVIFHAPSKQTLDPRTIQQSIIVAEERFIRPAIGDALYEALCNAKNVLVTDANKAALQAKMTAITINNGDIVNAFEEMSTVNQKLWKQYLWKLTAEAVLIASVPDAFLQFSSEGIVHGAPPAGPMNSAGVVGPNLQDVKWLMDKKILDRIDPLVTATKNFICRNKLDYPLYTDCPCDDEPVPPARKSQFIMNIYDDDVDTNCDCR